MARIKLGEAVTDSNGIAVFEYTGTGSGLMDVRAVNGDVQSEPYPVIDCTWIDEATSGSYDTTKWNVYNASVSTGTSDGRTITGNTNNQFYTKINITDDFCILVEAKTNNSNNYRLGFRIGSTNTILYCQNTNTDFKYFRFKRIDGVFTMESSTDGVNWTTETKSSSLESTDYVNFVFVLTASDSSVSYRNFRLYPI